MICCDGEASSNPYYILLLSKLGLDFGWRDEYFQIKIDTSTKNQVKSSSSGYVDVKRNN